MLTVKGPDGFCLWPTELSQRNIQFTPFADGQGDLVRSFSDECHQQELDFAIYISPWDQYEGTYGTLAYNDFFRGILRELITNYGDISEIWLDGANGEGPNGKQQEYEWESYFELIRSLQPNAIISVKGPDVRWVGTETGLGRETEWGIVPFEINANSLKLIEEKPTFVTHLIDPMQSDLGSRSQILEADYVSWYPSTTSIGLRPGTYYNGESNGAIKNSKDLLDIYFNSVGRNAHLMITTQLWPNGTMAEVDKNSLADFADAIEQIFSENMIKNAVMEASSNAPSPGDAVLMDEDLESFWQPNTEDETPSLTISLNQQATFNIISISEQISSGQKVESFAIEYWDEESWLPLAQGTTIGNRRLIRTKNITTEHIRIIFNEFRATPRIAEVGLFKNLPITSFQPKGVAFTDNISVKLFPDDSLANIFYTTDGTLPNEQSAQYDQPIRLNQTTEINAISILANGVKGYINTQIYNKAKYKVLLENAPHIKYTAGGSLILTDGVFGGNQHDNNRWLGFDEKDFVAIIDLKNEPIEMVNINFLQNPVEKILLPVDISYYGSNRLKGWRRLGYSKISQDDNAETLSHTVTRQFNRLPYRYLKIVARNRKKVGTGQIGEGEAAWVFVDEILLN